MISLAVGKSPAPDVEHTMSELKITEKIALLSGIDAWHTAPVHRLGVPSVRMSDGPNGVRGTRFFQGVPAACLPCGTGLAATWDTNLVQQGGALQGAEAIAKGASVLLGPTTNMQRFPLGGRGFESFSEDPDLAGAMSAATVNGIQSTGVAATIKHYVCNDQEDQRSAVDALVTERALREIYLMPFMIAQRDAQPLCYMTSYNRVNGIHASECPRLIGDILRKEWAFDGLVMSDWYGTYSTTEATKAGLDLEMPGPPALRGDLIRQAMMCGKLLEHDLDQRVRKVLELVKRVEPLGLPEGAPEGTVDTPETAAFLRKLSSNSIVLLKNDNAVLPFSRAKTTAVIGPNAAYAAYCRGGSASLLPYYAVSPLEGIRDKVPNVQYNLGVPGWKNLPVATRVTKVSADGPLGLTMKVFLDPPSVPDREHIDELHITDSNILLSDYKHPKLTSEKYWCELSGTFTPDETASYDFGLMVAGTGKVMVDDKCVVDNETSQHAGSFFFGSGTREERGSLELIKGHTYNLRITYGTLPTQTFRTAGTTGYGAGGLRFGLERAIDPVEEVNKAVELAKQVDQVVLSIGLNSEWESEGFDRPHMDFPPGTDDLVLAILAANPNTATVVQSGTPVTMPWLSKAPTVLHAWYGGNEGGNAIADVVFNDENPSGKLPLTFPIRNEDNPAFLTSVSQRNRVVYGEDTFIRYRFYEATKKNVAFPFGHGLSYTTFNLSNLSVQDDSADNNDHKALLSISLQVENTGSYHGAQVVQVYVRHKNSSILRAPKELKGFQKVFVSAGQTKTVTIFILKRYAASFWDEARDAWAIEQGEYELLIGDSSANTRIRGSFHVRKSSWWNGL
ncbi:beta-glucosidase [Sarocladium strictum]